MKNTFKFIAPLVLVAFAAVGCTTNGNDPVVQKKFGFVSIGDETDGYSTAHLDGISKALSDLGLNAGTAGYAKSVGDGAGSKTGAESLIAEGCTLIISNSYGHQDYMYQLAQTNPNVQFSAATGDYAWIGKLDNYSNAFNRTFEARYVSGVVAGKKVKELVEANKLATNNYDKDGNVKIGYVGAFNYAEVVSGYTAFYLGVKSVYEKVVMEVKYTDSWSDVDRESQAAEYLVGNGAVIISQHADTIGAPSKVETLLNNGKACYSVGYNISMENAAPHAALTSATNDWSVYYKYAIDAANKGEKIARDWTGGYKEGAVGITNLTSACAAGTAEAVKAAEDAIKAGTLRVFDSDKYTITGDMVKLNNDNYRFPTLDKAGHVTGYQIDFSYKDWSQGGKVIHEGPTKEVIKTANGFTFFDESNPDGGFRSAPYFDLRIDGITEVAYGK